MGLNFFNYKDKEKQIPAEFKKIAKEDVFKNTKLLLQVHDELIFEIKNDSSLPLAIKKISNLMANAHLPLISFNTPIVVSIGQGENWDEAH